jgi:hypothetical protein
LEEKDAFMYRERGMFAPVCRGRQKVPHFGMYSFAARRTLVGIHGSANCNPQIAWRKNNFLENLIFWAKDPDSIGAMLGRFEPNLYRALFYTTPSVSRMKEITRRTVHEYRYAYNYP